MEAALAQAEQSLKDGAESMRPDAEIVGAEEEIRRLLPAVLALKQSGRDPECRINGFFGELIRSFRQAVPDDGTDFSWIKPTQDGQAPKRLEYMFYGEKPFRHAVHLLR